MWDMSLPDRFAPLALVAISWVSVGVAVATGGTGAVLALCMMAAAVVTDLAVRLAPRGGARPLPSPEHHRSDHQRPDHDSTKKETA
ncbi:hypothetical protein [Yunchengibacter salinarum]|uniref:hypothetical protein n=1 Tax=Yunchengibacter salinarum TaxID=3133399 RepID=UPI0035B58B3B